MDYNISGIKQVSNTDSNFNIKIKQEIKNKKNIEKYENTETKWNELFIYSKIYMIALGLICVFIYNQFFGLFIDNPIANISNWLSVKLGFNLRLLSLLTITVTLATLWLSMKRDFWLPFLGKTVLPSPLMSVHQPSIDTNKVITLKTIPNTKVVYWASIKDDEKGLVQDAYGKYENSGVVMSNDEGVANLTISESSGYIVPNGKHIPRHVHYRLVDNDTGMVGRVETIYY